MATEMGELVFIGNMLHVLLFFLFVDAFSATYVIQLLMRGKWNSNVMVVAYLKFE
jgi:hypothetical protein